MKNTRNKEWSIHGCGGAAGRERRVAGLLRSAAAAAILCIGASACDVDPSDEAVERGFACDFADEECAALPAVAAVVELLESMDIDLGEASVELDEATFHARGVEEATQAQKSTCNSNEAWACCCYWDGPFWGCECH